MMKSAAAISLGCHGSLNDRALMVVFSETGIGPAKMDEVSVGSELSVVYRIVAPSVCEKMVISRGGE